MENIVFIVSDGIGKNIMATAPLRGIRQKYPDSKITIVASHPEVFRGNPHVDEIYAMQATPNFYENHKDAMVLCAQPYYHPDYISKKKHLIDCWCEQLDIPCDGEGPEIFLNKLEKEKGLDFIRSKNRPVLAIQWQGGASPKVAQDGSIVTPKMFVRGLHSKVVQNIIATLQEKYHILCLEYSNQPHIMGAEPFYTNLRDTFSVINSANKLLCIDSFAMHAAKGMGKDSVVCWAGTNPNILGYKSNINIRMNECPDPECGRPNSFLLDVDFKNEPWVCPYGELCTRHDEQDILDALGV